MRMLVPALAVLGLMAVGGCATQKTYETVLNVCSSGNGTVKTASVVKSSGDPAVDQHAINTVAKSMVYEESSQLTCKPLTVEYKLTGQAA